MERNDYERAVLGAFLLENGSFFEVADLLTEDAFHNTAHREIFAAIRDMHNAGRDVDLLTVIHELRGRQRLEYVGGPVFVSMLTNHVASTAHIGEHAMIIMQEHYRDQLMQSAAEMMRVASDPTRDVFEALAESRNILNRLDDATDARREPNKQEILYELGQDIERAKQTGLAGISTGIPELDEQLGGLEPGLFIIAGRPGSGKTALAVSIAEKMSIVGNNAGAFFSLEASTKQLFRRFVAVNGDIRSSHMRSGNMSGTDWENFATASDRIVNAGLNVYSRYRRIEDIISKARVLHRLMQLDYLIIDYLQLMRTAMRGNREQEVSHMSRQLKELSEDLNIPVIALSQLSREVEKRPDKKPQLSDLRESGAIEQDADTVLFTYRPSYYGIRGEDGEDLSDKAYVIQGKHRHGSLQDIELHYKYNHNQEWGTVSSRVLSAQTEIF